MDYTEAHDLQKRARRRTGGRGIPDQLLLLEHPAGPDPRPSLGSGPHPRVPGDAGGPRDRRPSHRARRRGDLSRPRPAGGVPDHRPRRSEDSCSGRSSAPSRRPWSRRARRSVSRPTVATVIPAAGAMRTVSRRARSGPSDCASSAASRTTASRSMSAWTWPTSSSSTPCGMPGVVSTSIDAGAARHGTIRCRDPSTASVERAAMAFAPAFAAAIGASPTWPEA